MATLNSGTRDGHTDGGAHGSGGSRRRDAGEALQGGEVEGVASRAEAKERERAHRGHGSTTGGHGCSSEREGEAARESARGSEGEWERSSASALVLHYVEQGTGARGSRAAMVGRELLHGDHVGVPSNRWQALEWARWTPECAKSRLF